MITETITYTDYNGNERTEDFLFNLTNAELTEMMLSENGGLDEKIKQIVAAQNGPEIIKIFKDIILKSYGVKSLDGKRFIKSDELREEFSQTEAYSQLFMKLSQDSEAAAKFIEGVIPADVAHKVKNNPKALLEKAIIRD